VFGCLRRAVFLVVLLLMVPLAYATRDRWLPIVRGAAGGAAKAVTDASTDSAAMRAADTGWASLSFPASEKGRQAVSRLASGKGPAMVILGAPEFAGALLDSLTAQLPPSTDSVQVRAEGNELQIRASVKLGDLGGRAVLGPMASMLGDRERLTLGGTLEPGTTPGVAEFTLTRVRIGDVALPGPLVPKLLQAIRRGATGSASASGALPIRLPAGVGDVRVAQGRITLYRTAP
jgi:hypothetical protein